MRTPNFHAEPTDGWAKISHMRPIQARKLKLFQTWISKWRRQRRRPNNSPIWPETWTITPRDQISHSGSIPPFDITWMSFITCLLWKAWAGMYFECSSVLESLFGIWDYLECSQTLRKSCGVYIYVNIQQCVLPSMCFLLYVDTWHLYICRIWCYIRH